MSPSKKFDSDNEWLNPIFSVSKKFDSDNECLNPTVYFHCSKIIFLNCISWNIGIKVLNHNGTFSLSKKFNSDNECIKYDSVCFVISKRMWSSGIVVDYKPEELGSLPGGVTVVLWQSSSGRSSTFVKNLNKFDGYHLRSSTLALHL